MQVRPLSPHKCPYLPLGLDLADNNPLAALAADNTSAAVDMALRMDLVEDHRVLVGMDPAGMDWDCRSRTVVEEVSLDILALEGLLDRHRSARVVGSLVEDRQACSAGAVSRCETSRYRMYTYICHDVDEVVSDEEGLTDGTGGWRCGVEASTTGILSFDGDSNATYINV